MNRPPALPGVTLTIHRNETLQFFGPVLDEDQRTGGSFTVQLYLLDHEKTFPVGRDVIRASLSAGVV